MKLHKAIKKAFDEKDIEALMSLYHEDFEFIRHQSGTTLKKPEYRELNSRMLSDASFTEVMHRCIYENDEILVEHSVMRFQDGSRESLISVKMIENGQVIRQETGASPMK
jgi:ketosteroid isomerase-like protein